MLRIVMALVVLSSAAGLRILLGLLGEAPLPPTPIRLPLEQFPQDAMGPRWSGEDIPLAEDVHDVARVADYLQRYYTDGERGFWLYVGYVDHYEHAAIHHPGVCFPATGLRQLEEGTVEVPCPDCPKGLSFRETRWARPLGGEIYSLSAFYFRGGFAPTDWYLRTSEVLGIPYFAIVTLSAEVVGSLAETEAIAKEALCRAVKQLLRHLPE